MAWRRIHCKVQELHLALYAYCTRERLSQVREERAVPAPISGKTGRRTAAARFLRPAAPFWASRRMPWHDHCLYREGEDPAGIHPERLNPHYS